MEVWKLKDLHYNHQILRILANKGSITTITSPNVQAYLIANDCTGHVEGSCMGTDNSITSANCNHQNCNLRCICHSAWVSKLVMQLLQWSSLLFWGYCQLDHSLKCENIKCLSHTQIISWIKSYNSFKNLCPLIVLQK